MKVVTLSIPDTLEKKLRVKADTEHRTLFLMMLTKDPRIVQGELPPPEALM